MAPIHYENLLRSLERTAAGLEGNTLHDFHRSPAAMTWSAESSPHLMRTRAHLLQCQKPEKRFALKQYVAISFRLSYLKSWRESPKELKEI
jgi:hypothetical protein